MYVLAKRGKYTVQKISVNFQSAACDQISRKMLKTKQGKARRW